MLRKLASIFNLSLPKGKVSPDHQSNNEPLGQASESKLNTPEYLPDGWKPRETERKGWDAEEMVEHYRKTWTPFLARLQGPEPINFAPGDPHGASLVYQNTVLVFGYSVALASSGKNSISMLDWGGAVGHYLPMARALLPGVEVDYHCKDMPSVVDFARGLLTEAKFYSDHSCLNRPYDFVLASGSLQFSEDWRTLFADLVRATAGYILVTRIPIVEQSPSFVFAHITNFYGYKAEFLAWCWNRQEFHEYADSLNLELVREFLVDKGHQIRNAPEQPVYYGFLYKRRG